MKLVEAVVIVGIVALQAVSVNADPLFQDSFEKGAGAWTKNNQAEVSDVSRRAGTKSLLIRQTKDEEQNSSWLSPAIKSAGNPVTISFWAADNYLVMRDFTYAACVDVVSYDKDGKQTGESDSLFSFPWDDARKESMWGQFLPSGLVWKYHERVCMPRGDTFRIKFHWPKPLARGDCYLTDIMVTEATPAEAAAQSATAASGVAAASESNLRLEISLPVVGNLFYRDDPLQVQVLVYSKDQKPFTLPADVKLEYAITDYQSFAIGKGQADWSGAKRVEDASFYKAPTGTTRKENLLKTIVLDTAAAKEPGREFFLDIRLSSQDTVLASDTVTYGYVNPRAMATGDYEKCHFILNKFTRSSYPGWGEGRKESISEKNGTAWAEDYDIGWVNLQPHYPGPINFGPKRPAFPRLIWCANIEQERGSEKWIRTLVPPEAIIPDPLYPGRITFQIEPYVEYMVAYIRHNREAIARVVPSGLERRIDARTVELHRKAYAAIKKEFPDLPVGFMIYGLPLNPSTDVDIFLREKLYECADFIDTHVYASSVDWSEWERLQAEYKKMGKTPPPLISTEFCRVGGMDQVQKSRDMIASHLDAIAHGMGSLCYYNTMNSSRNLPEPFLRGDTDLGGDMVSGFMYMQRIDRPRMAPDLIMEERLKKDYRWSGDFGGGSIMPLLQTMTYYNLVQNFETAAYRETIHPDPDTLGYVFDRDNTTIAALWLQRPVGKKTFLVKAPAPFRVQDLYGREDRVTPVEGGVLLTVDENPLMLVFDRKLDKVAIAPVSGGMKVAPVARGADGSVELTLTGDWGYSGALKVVCTVDGTWPGIKDKSVTLEKGKEAKVSLPFAVDLARAVGVYPLTARLYAGEKLAGVLKDDLKIRELLTAGIGSIPMTKTNDPAIVVTVRSLGNAPMKGTVILDDRYFTPDMRPQVQEKPYTIPPKGSAELVFPVSRAQVNLSTAYEIPIVMKDKSGIKLSVTDEVGFRACEKAPGAIQVDGDLADWKLDERTAIPFSREFSDWAKSNKPPIGAGTFYTVWDDNNLYFAVVQKKHTQFTHRANTVSIWRDDNIMFGLYPWSWKLGQALNSGYYREHLGLCQDGKARIFRVGNVAGGPTNDEGTQIAVKQTADGYVYEWCYSRKSLYPLDLKTGAGFRLSLFALDADPDIGLRGIQIGGFNENVDSRPVRWREFILTP